ncbi:signal peptidase II [Candidatus Woesearchaeota archaeon]|nr:signal peptidase II [Candidatus Woesearchaeota archaeon]
MVNNFRTKLYKFPILILITFFVFIFDFIFKNLFYNKDLLLFTYLKNGGALFGLFEGHLVGIIICSIIFAIILLLCYIYLNEILKYKFVKKIVSSKHKKLFNLSLILLFAGTIANLVDRVVYGYVRDYISIWMFPVFNLADASIFIGACMLIFLIFNLD